MIPELEILYNRALESRDLARWLVDEDLIRDHQHDERSASKKQEELLAVLEGEELALFQRFLDSLLARTDAEHRMLFSQGFAIGLRFGSLCVWR